MSFTFRITSSLEINPVLTWLPQEPESWINIDKYKRQQYKQTDGHNVFNNCATPYKQRLALYKDRKTKVALMEKAIHKIHNTDPIKLALYEIQEEYENHNIGRVMILYKSFISNLSIIGGQLNDNSETLNHLDKLDLKITVIAFSDVIFITELN